MSSGETGGGGFEEIEEVDEFAEDADVGLTFFILAVGYLWRRVFFFGGGLAKLIYVCSFSCVVELRR